MRRTIHLLATAVSTAALAGAASASETISYSYDELGRLLSSSSSGSVNNGVASTTSYDSAGNRTNYSVTGSSGTPPPPGTVWTWNESLPGTGGGFEPGKRAHGTAFLRAVSGDGRPSMPASETAARSAGEPSPILASPF